jgi:hypothetical protein
MLHLLVFIFLRASGIVQDYYFSSFLIYWMMKGELLWAAAVVMVREAGGHWGMPLGKTPCIALDQLAFKSTRS